MSKIIIQNDTDLTDDMAMRYVSRVIDKGLISNGTYGEQYCHLVTFGDPTKYVVSCTKRKSGTQTFRVYEYGGVK